MTRESEYTGVGGEGGTLPGRPLHDRLWRIGRLEGDQVGGLPRLFVRAVCPVGTERVSFMVCEAC